MYVLLDYGDFIDGSTSNTAAPYVQLLPTTDTADFGAMRLDTTDSQQHSGSTTISGSSSGGGGFFQKYKIPIFVGAAVVGLAVFLLAVWLVTRQQRKPSYRPLFEPAPAGDMQMHHVSGYNGGPQPQYADPWTHRR